MNGFILIMISDISTACYEWFHFDKPIVFANPAPEHYHVSSDIGSNTYAWQAGDVINKKEDILTHIENNLAADLYKTKRNEIFEYTVADLYKTKRNEIFEYTVFQPDGHASERQAESIIEYYNRFEKVPYWWLIFSTMIYRRTVRNISKSLNWYYRIFRKDKIGK